MLSILRIVFLLCISLSVVHTLKAQTAFEFNGEQVAPGTKAHFLVPVADETDETLIPITIFHGAVDGPVLGITAGVHGYEYAPILAGQALIQQIDPKQLRGTVILVQIANLESFLGRSPYVSPLDGVNLNRAFPGVPNGSVTQRIADYISQLVIARCDYFVDAHSGDAPEDLMPYVAYYQHDEKKEISEEGRAMAAHMGYNHVIVFKTTGKDYMAEDKPSLYCSAEAFKQGIPAVDIECGRLGIIEQAAVDKIVSAIHSLLSHLKMAEGVRLPTEGIAFIEERASISSGHTGFFYPLKTSGDVVTEGAKIGYITNFFNETLEEVYANADGIILYILGTPPVNKGETLVSIGKQEG